MIKTIQAHQSKILFAFIALLFTGFSFLVFYRLGVHPFIDWDESIYAQVAKESLENKQFFDLTYFDNAWYEKPPLAFWLMSGSYAIGGVNEWSARIPSALGAIGMVVLSLRWVWELRKSYAPVILTMAGYFIMFPFITSAYFVNLDTIVGLFAMLSLYGWWKAQENKNWLIVWGLAIGLGVMTKNVVGLFPLLPIAVYAISHKQLPVLKTKQFWYGIMAAGLVVLPWHIYQSIVAGKAFWQNYLVYHVLQRYNTSLESNGAPFLYYFQIVFQKYYIALVVFGGSLLVAAWLSWKDRGIRYLLLSAVLIFLLFSSSITKLPSYISTMLPLFVMISGISLAKIIDYLPKKWMQALVVVVLTVVFAYTGYAFNTYKLAQAEYAEEYLDNKAVGEFLKDYRGDLPVYVNYTHYKNLGIGFYAERKVTPTEDMGLINGATERVFRKHTQSVFLGDGYIVIKR